MSDIAIFDSHMHLMDPARFNYQWLAEAPPLARAFSPEDYAAARRSVNVEGCVFIEVWTAAEQRMAEVGWVSELARTNPVVRAIVAAVSLEDPAATQQYIEQLRHYPLVRGIRRITEPEMPDFTLAPAYLQSTRLLGKEGLTSDLCILNHQIVEAAKLAQLCPDTHFVLDHLGKPDIGMDGFDVARWRQDLKELSRRPNVVAKISGLVNRARQPSTLEQVRPYVEYLIECFGVDRCMFGSDWPVVTLGGTYEHWVTLLDAATKSYSDDERSRLFSGTAKAIYRI
jgi:L-fuconolactonase